MVASYVTWQIEKKHRYTHAMILLHINEQISTIIPHIYNNACDKSSQKETIGHFNAPSAPNRIVMLHFLYAKNVKPP